MKKDNIKKQQESENNGGSGAFNQGSEQDPEYNNGTPVTDEEKRTGKPADPGRQKEKPENGNIGKNNAGGYK